MNGGMGMGKVYKTSHPVSKVPSGSFVVCAFNFFNVKNLLARDWHFLAQCNNNGWCLMRSRGGDETHEKEHSLIPGYLFFPLKRSNSERQHPPLAQSSFGLLECFSSSLRFKEYFKLSLEQQKVLRELAKVSQSCHSFSSSSKVGDFAITVLCRLWYKWLL